MKNQHAQDDRSQYQSALFDEHVTSTPTLYINEVRYTGATDVESLLLAIKQADTEGSIQFPGRANGVREQHKE